MWKFEWSNSQASVSLLVLDCFFVTLSPLLLHDELHLAFRVFDYGSGDFDHIGYETRRPSESVFARPEFVDVFQFKDISNRDVV